MAYDADLAARIRQCLARRRGIAEKKMFGGIGFLWHGNMCVGIWKDALVARVGPEAYETSLREPGVREFDITGRAMQGWVLVGANAVETEADVKAWVESCLNFVRTLPPK